MKKDKKKLYGKRNLLNLDGFAVGLIRQVAAGDIAFLEKLKYACKSYVDTYDDNGSIAKEHIWKENAVLEEIQQRGLHELPTRDAWAFLKNYKIIDGKARGLNLKNWHDGRSLQLDKADVPEIEEKENEMPAYQKQQLSDLLDDYDANLNYGTIVNLAIQIYTFFNFLEQVIQQIQEKKKEQQDLIENKSGKQKPVGKAIDLINRKKKAFNDTFPSEHQIVHVSLGRPRNHVSTMPG
jgi:hypothetical protein